MNRLKLRQLHRAGLRCNSAASRRFSEFWTQPVPCSVNFLWRTSPPLASPARPDSLSERCTASFRTSSRSLTPLRCAMSNSFALRWNRRSCRSWSELADLSRFNPASLLHDVVDAYVLYLDANPDFRAISFGRHISAATKELEASPNVGLPSLLK